MSSLFTLADAAIGRLNFAAKITLIVVLFLLPIGYLGSLQYIISRDQVATASREDQGLSYLAAIRDVYEKIPQHRGLSQAVLKGNGSARGKLEGVRQEVDARFASLAALDRALDTPLDSSGAIDRLHMAWESLSERNATLEPAQSFAEHTALIGELTDLMANIADRVGLSHDSDVTTFHSARLLIDVLPTVAEYLGRTRGLASGIAAAGSYTPGLYTKLSTNVEFVEFAHARMARPFADMARVAPGMSAKLDAQVRTANQQIDGFLQLLSVGMLADEEQITVESEEVFRAGTSAISATFALYDTLVTALRGHLAESRAAAQTQGRIVLAVTAGTLLVLLYFLAGFYRVVTRSVRCLADGAQQIATGDLSARVSLGVRDELAQVETAINALASNIGGLIGEVQRAGAAVDEATERMGSVTTGTRESMAQQQLQISQVATAINEMNATVHEVAQSASRTAEATHDARSQVEQGKRIVGESKGSNENLAHAVERASGVIAEVATNSNEIGGVLDMIRSIAEQTNLLALNAAIEAARAGEQGRGFAVVADEVRTLAGRTQQSTQEIQDMIERLQLGAHEAVQVMQEGQRQAGISVEHAESAARALGAINDAILQISDMSSQIASAAEEQSAATEEINQSVVHIDRSSQSTHDATTLAEQTGSELRRLAGELLASTSRFHL